MRPRIDKNTVLRYLGYSGQEIDDNLMSHIDLLISKCEAAEGAKSVARYYDIVENSGDEVLLKDCTLKLQGRDISRHLRGCVGCVLFACTLGVKVNSEITKLNAKSVLDGVIYNAAASDLIERAADIAQAKLCDSFKEHGMLLGRRYSPGYGDFPIEIQGALLAELMAAKKIGLFVTRAGMLTPTKSITAVMGVSRLDVGALDVGGDGGAGASDVTEDDSAGGAVDGADSGAGGAVDGADSGAFPENDARASFCKSCVASKDCMFLENGSFCN